MSLADRPPIPPQIAPGLGLLPKPSRPSSTTISSTTPVARSLVPTAWMSPQSTATSPPIRSSWTHQQHLSAPVHLAGHRQRKQQRPAIHHSTHGRANRSGFCRQHACAGCHRQRLSHHRYRSVRVSRSRRRHSYHGRAHLFLLPRKRRHRLYPDRNPCLRSRFPHRHGYVPSRQPADRHVTISSGVATLSNFAMTPGVHALYVSYPGQGSFSPAISVIIIVAIEQYSTSLDLTSTIDPSIVGQPVTFTVTGSTGNNAIPNPDTLTDTLTNTLLSTFTLTSATQSSPPAPPPPTPTSSPLLPPPPPLLPPRPTPPTSPNSSPSPCRS